MMNSNGFHLSRHSRQAVLAIHIVTGVAWIGVNLALAILLLPNALSTSVPDPALSADRLRDQFDPVSLLMPPIVSSVALVAATVLSVYKPPGRVRLLSR